MSRMENRGLSDIIGFFIILILILLVLVPLLLYLTFSYSNNFYQTNQIQPSLAVLNVSYTPGLLIITYPSNVEPPVIQEIYNYTPTGVWVIANYTLYSKSPGEIIYSINGQAPVLLVQLYYLNQTYYVKVGINSYSLVG